MFPVYSIRGADDVIREENGKIYVDNGYSARILDDATLEGTLGIRRLRLIESGFDLYPLAIKYSTWDQLLSRKSKSKAHSLFIDNTGYVFKHTPSVKIPIDYKRLRKQVTKPREHTLLYVQGEIHPIKIAAPFNPGVYYCGIGKVKGKLILFDVSSEPKGRTWRKI